MSDPRLRAVEVNHVDLSPDGRHALVLVGLRGDDKVQREALAGLDHARHYLRHELARRLSLRRVPELHFDADPGGETEDRIERLLQRARKTRGQDEKLSSK
jgi:ribosome-binding factor A